MKKEKSVELIRVSIQSNFWFSIYMHILRVGRFRNLQKSRILRQFQTISDILRQSQTNLRQFSDIFRQIEFFSVIFQTILKKIAFFLRQIFYPSVIFLNSQTISDKFMNSQTILPFSQTNFENSQTKIDFFSKFSDKFLPQRSKKKIFFQ